MIANEPVLSRESVEEQGFAIVSNVLNGEEISSLAMHCEEMDRLHGRAGARHLMKDPVIAALARKHCLIALAESVLGAGARSFKATLFDKSPESNWLIAWHQDTALPLLERRDTPGWGPWSVKEGITYAHAPASALRKILALRLHLDNSTELNGPLRVLAGTHTRGILSDDEVDGLVKELPQRTCLVPKGGVLIMRPLLIHASSKSVTAASRRVLHIEYAPTSPIAQGLQLAIA